MINSFIYYVLESSICLLLFLMVYRLLIANLTHFSWMRIYLLSSVILSLILPLLILPVHWITSIHPFNQFNNFNFLPDLQHGGYSEGQPSSDFRNSSGSFLKPVMIIMAITVCLAGILYKAYYFAMNLRSIQKCIKQNPKVREDRFWLLYLNDKVPPFSFFNYIFIANSCKSLPEVDLQRIKNHEKIHAQQFHSLDVLFIEFISIFFWFNPVMIYLKKSIQEIHEYTVDEKVAEGGERKKDYAELLLKLASDVKSFNLSAGFSDSQIKRRIVMISKPRSLPAHKLLFTILLPIILLLLLSFSFLKNPDPITAQTKLNETVNQSQLKIGKITWNGNTVYDIKTLNNAFGLKTGSIYTHSLTEDRLNGSLGAKDAVSFLYLDNGYLFSRITFEEKQNKESVDLTITVYEGKQAKIGDVIFKVNGKVSDPGIDIGISRGELFSRAKIIKSIKAIAASGKFDPEKINPSPLPHDKGEFASVDLIYELTEISNKK